MQKEILLKNGETLLLREAKPADAAAMLQYFTVVGGETDNLLFDANGLPYTLEQEKAFIQSMQDDERQAFFVGFIGEELVCTGSLQTPAQKRIAHTGELALAVRKSCWNKGVGSAVMAALIEYARCTGLKYLHLGVRADNMGGRALYKKMGFAEAGRHPGFFCVNGEYCDEILMGLPL